jgi:hypothetical protein
VRLPYLFSHSECPWESPYIYYADPSTRQCVVTCPTTPALYANDYTQTCVNRKAAIIKRVHGIRRYNPITMIIIVGAYYVALFLCSLSLRPLLLRAKQSHLRQLRPVLPLRNLLSRLQPNLHLDLPSLLLCKLYFKRGSISMCSQMSFQHFSQFFLLLCQCNELPDFDVCRSCWRNLCY